MDSKVIQWELSINTWFRITLGFIPFAPDDPSYFLCGIHPDIAESFLPPELGPGVIRGGPVCLGLQDSCWSMLLGIGGEWRNSKLVSKALVDYTDESYKFVITNFLHDLTKDLQTDTRYHFVTHAGMHL